MSEPATQCNQCQKPFNLLRWSRTCHACKREFCSKCRPDRTDRPSLCGECDGVVRERMDAMIVAKAGEVEGHQITETLGPVESALFDTPKEAMAYVTFTAALMGGNAILNYYCEQGIVSRLKPDVESGHAHYPTFKAMGTVVVLAPDVVVKAW